MKYTRVQIATIITIAFHLSGFISMCFFHSQFFINLTPLNLLIGIGLIFYTQQSINKNFIFFFIFASAIGFFAEWLGVNKAVIFGNYSYGKVLGPQWQNVPIIIGANWFAVMYCCGISMHMLKEKLFTKQPDAAKTFPKWFFFIGLVADTAILAVILDWAMEPIAMRLGFWQWKQNEIPITNYYSWYIVAAIIAVFFQLFKFKKQNLFAVHLLMIQFLFFLMMKTFLK